MTHNFHSDIVLKKRGTRLKRLGLISLVLICIVGVAILADLFSSALTVGSFSFGLFKNGNFNIKDRSLYAVTMGESNDKFKAYNIAGGSSVLGAGGYVWYENDTYYVIANIYKNKSDAEKIADNISTSNYTVNVKEIKLKGVSANIDGLEKSDKKIIYNSINRLYSLYEEIYDLSNNIDTKTITHIQASSMVNNYKSNCKILDGSLTEIMAKNNNATISNLHTTYIYVIEILDNLVYKLLETDQATSIIKNSESEIVYRMYNFLKSV